MSYELTKDRHYKHNIKMKLLHHLHMPLCNSTSFHFHSNSNKHKHHKSFSRNSNNNSYTHYHHPTFYALTRNSNNINNNIHSNSNNNSNACCKLKSIQDYKNEVKCIMQQYSYRSPQYSRFNKIENLLSKTKQCVYISKKNEISKLFNQHKSSSLYHNLETEDTKIQISSGKYGEYNDPIETLGVITRNKVIHDQLLENYQHREVQQFERSMSQISCIESQKKLAELVKVTPTMPKIIEQNIFIHKKNNSVNPKYTTTTNNNEQGIVTISSHSERANNNNIKYIPKKKKIINISNINFMKKKLHLLAKTIYSTKTFPENREQFSFSPNANGNTIYLYGGYSSNIRSNSLWRLETSNLTWTNLPSIAPHPDLRTGHTGIVYKNKYIIFGGHYVHIPLYADIDIYYTDIRTWSTPSINTSHYLRLRKHHIACLIGQHMFIHGGIGDNGEYLNDCYLLQMNPLKWKEAKVSLYCEHPYLAMHACALVLTEDIRTNNKFNVYKYPEVSPSKKVFSRIKEKGLYVFGGKSKDECKPNNMLRVLRVGRKPLEWVTLDTKGEAPSPRYMCSLNYYEEGNYVVVYGGRNDLEDKSSAFNDMYVFELYRLEWLRVVFCDKVKALNRYNHGAVVSGKHLIVFGGMNGERFLGSGLFVVNLDPEEAVIQNKKPLSFHIIHTEYIQRNNNNSNNSNNNIKLNGVN